MWGCISSRPRLTPSTGGGLGRFPGQTGPTGAQYRRTLIMSYVNVNDINDIANRTYLWLYQQGVCCAAAWPTEAGPGRPGSPACARGGVSRGALNHPFASPLATPPHRVRGTSQRDLASIRPQVAEAHTSRSTGFLRAKENPARMLGPVEAGCRQGDPGPITLSLHREICKHAVSHPLAEQDALAPLAR